MATNGSTINRNGSSNLNDLTIERTVVHSTTTIEDLYKYFGVLADAKDQAGKHVETYLQIISGTKSGSKEKQLSAQFIARFFKFFPKEMPIAIDAIFDLCEDDDVNIRKAAIKDLASLCKDCAVEHLNRIADILTQLLQTDDLQEFVQVQSSLLTVFKQNPKSTLNEIFNQINTAELEEVRKRAIKFLVGKIPVYLEQSTASGVSTKDLEEVIVKHVKTVLIDVDAEEFILFIRLLTSLSSMNTLTGRQDLVNIIMAQSELDKPFDANDAERLMILLSCIQQAIPLFSKNVQSTKFVNYYLDNVISIVAKISDETIKFEILKSFADLCIHYHSTPQQNTINNIDLLYNLLIEYLPKPLENDDEQQEEAKFNFSYVECLMFSFHMLAKQQVDFLSGEDNKERLKEFRLRLQYFAKGTQNYIKELRNSLNNLTPANKEQEQNKIRRVALKVTTNIDLLIKDFFHNPPSYKSSITLSWKSDIQKGNDGQVSANKRSLSVSNIDTNNDAEGKKKPERGIYQPPSGKYSTNQTANSKNGEGVQKRRIFSNGGNINRRGGRF